MFTAVKAAKPRSIFMEPVNLRLGIAKRIETRARELGLEMDMTIYDDGPLWVRYAIQSLKDAESAAKATDQSGRLHLWPDHKALGAKRVVASQPDPDSNRTWLQGYWDRISEWPGKAKAR